MAKERRYLKQQELRATRGDKGATIQGYAAKFNVISEDLGGFREVLLPGCFDLEASPDVICNYEHEDCDLLGRRSSGMLTLSTDETGLAIECLAPNTTVGNDVVELIGRRDLKDMSFAFEVDGADGEEWGETEDGTPLRKIKRCILYDVAIVVHPAYPDTELALRSLAKAKSVAPPRLPNLLARLRLAEAELDVDA